jgi:hypothetical protein
MSRDGTANRIGIIYVLRSSGQAAAVSVVDDPDAEQVVYMGSLSGLETVFDQSLLRMTVPRSFVSRARLAGEEGRQQLLVDEGVLADEVYLGLLPLSGQEGREQFAIVGSLVLEGEVVDVVAVDDPVTTIALVGIGAALLMCLLKLGVAAVLVDRAHARATTAGDKPSLVIDTSTDSDVKLTAARRLRAILRCRVRGEVRSAGAVVDSESAAEI